MANKLTPAAKRAINKYTAAACVEAFKMHRAGWGASGIANEGPIQLRTARQADAAINAGREIFFGAVIDLAKGEEKCR